MIKDKETDISHSHLGSSRPKQKLMPIKKSGLTVQIENIPK